VGSEREYVPVMAPEAPGNLVVIDVIESEDGDGFRFVVERWDPTPDSRNFLWTLWAAEGDCPKGFVDAAGGVVCVAADPDFDHARYRARPRVRKDPHALSWGDVAQGVGIMIVAVLPSGWMYTSGCLDPVEAKPFDGRMALYWRTAGGSNGEVLLTWTIEPLHGSLRDACAELNELGPHAAPVVDPPLPRQEMLTEWAEHRPPVQPLPPGEPIISIQNSTVVIEGGVNVDVTQIWHQHADQIPLDVLAEQLERIRAVLDKRPDEQRALDDAVKAARAGDGPAALRALKRAGQLVLDVASKVGADVAAAAAKAGLGV
jgi:hypothetical protein